MLGFCLAATHFLAKWVGRAIEVMDDRFVGELYRDWYHDDDQPGLYKTIRMLDRQTLKDRGDL